MLGMTFKVQVFCDLKADQIIEYIRENYYTDGEM